MRRKKNSMFLLSFLGSIEEKLQKSGQARKNKGLLNQKTMTRAAEYLLGQSLNNKTSQTVAPNVSDSQDFKLCEMKSLQRGVFLCGKQLFLESPLKMLDERSYEKELLSVW